MLYFNRVLFGKICLVKNFSMIRYSWCNSLFELFQMLIFSLLCCLLSDFYCWFQVLFDWFHWRKLLIPFILKTFVIYSLIHNGDNNGFVFDLILICKLHVKRKIGGIEILLCSPCESLFERGRRHVKSHWLFFFHELRLRHKVLVFLMKLWQSLC